MGYTTEFEGCFHLDKPLTAAQKDYINRFAETRRMKRNPALLPEDPFCKSVGLPLGSHGEFFVAATGFMGQDENASVMDFNTPPAGQPGLWCQWVTDGETIFWDGGEKFYHYVQWIKYMISNFFIPWGYKLNGTVEWQGEEPSDRGDIIITDNNVQTKRF